MTNILDILPDAYRSDKEQQEVVRALTQAIQDLYDSLNTELNNYEHDYIDPKTCKEEWLDTLAEWAGWGDYWDSSRSADIKRQLLIKTDYLWANRGNRDVLRVLFEIFGLNVNLVPQSGWILGTSVLPTGLNVDPFGYLVDVPDNYTEGSPNRILVDRILKEFLPCWISLQYI